MKERVKSLNNQKLNDLSEALEASHNNFNKSLNDPRMLKKKLNPPIQAGQAFVDLKNSINEEMNERKKNG